MPIAEKKRIKVSLINWLVLQQSPFNIFSSVLSFTVSLTLNRCQIYQFNTWWIQYSPLAGRGKISMCVFTTIFSNFNGFQILVSNVTNAKFMNGSSNFYKGSWTCKVIKSINPSGPWLYQFLDLCKVYQYCALVEIRYYIFFVCFVKIIKQASRVSRIPFWVTGQGCMCLILNAHPEVQTLNGLYFNICLPFPSLGSFGSAYTVVPTIASKANVLNAKKEKKNLKKR